MFRARARFVAGGAAICRDCRAARASASIGPLRAGAAGPDATTGAFASRERTARPVEPGEYVLTRGRHAGTRVSEVPLVYLRACAYGRGSATPSRAHILWAADVRMMRLYLERTAGAES